MAGEPRQLIQLSDPRKQFRGDVSGSTGRGVVHATPQTSFGADPSIPGFLAQVMEPYIKRKQEASFYAGMAKQMEVGATAEIQDSDNPLVALMNEAWGPDHFVQGRAAFQAHGVVQKTMLELQSDTKLKELPPEQLAEHVSKKMQSMLTGNQWTDQLVQKSMIEQVGPFMNTVAKERFAWQQNGAVVARLETADAAASNLFALASKQAAAGTPESDAAVLATRSFQDLLMPAAGTSDASHKRYLSTMLTAMAEKGNGYAVEIMRKSGVMDLFPEERDKFEKTYEAAANRALGEFEKTLLPQMAEFHGKLILGQLSAEDATKQYAEWNRQARGATGFDRDLYGVKDVLSSVDGIYTQIRSTAQRNEDRAFAKEDREAQYAHEERLKLAEVEAEKRAADFAFSSGTANTAINGGYVTPAAMNAKAQAAVNSGDMVGLAKSFRTEGWSSSSAAETLQAGIKGTLGEGYSPAAQQAYDRWKALYSANAGAAATYYGDYHSGLLLMDSLMKTDVPPAQAYARAFATPGITDKIALPPGTVKKFDKQISQAVDRAEGKFLGFGTSLNPSSRKVVTSVISAAVARDLQFTPGVDPDVVLKGAYASAVSNGRLEHYGSFAWPNAKQGTVPIWQGTGIQRDEFGDVLDAVIDRKLKSVGFADGAQGSDYQITRMGENLYVTGYTKDYEAKSITVSKGELAGFQAQVVNRAKTEGLEIVRVAPNPNDPSEAKGMWRVQRKDGSGTLFKPGPDRRPGDITRSAFSD